MKTVLELLQKLLEAVFGKPKAPAPPPQPRTGPTVPPQPVEPPPGPVLSQPPAPSSPPAPDVPRPRQNQKLSEHFDLWQMTTTSNAALQARNRILTDAQVKKLTEVANLMETVMVVLGCKLDIHSAYRSPELNGATQGSSSTSQHPRCEACDFSPAGPDTEASIKAAFDKLVVAAKSGKFKFGQLIVEMAKRPYGKAVWIHISLGRPYRDQSRCGEVMKMVENAEGKPVYTMVGRIPQ